MEGELAYKVFIEEIELIEDLDMVSWLVATLNNAPEYFWVAPASMTGKYHPTCSNGKGGLIIHTKRVVYLANRICRAWGISGMDRDKVLTACILHDIAKPKPGSPYSHSDEHPLRAKNYFKEAGYEFINDIESCIQLHMGLWTPKSVKKSMNEYSLIELAVYTADYLSAQKDLGTPRDIKSE